MSLGAAEDDSSIEILLPADIQWEMLDKSKFFFLGATLFSGVSTMLYPVVLLKTRQQILVKDTPFFKMAVNILKHEGFKSMYRGFGTTLMGTIPARALYMGALELTKSNLGCTTVKLGFSEVKAAAITNAAAGLSAAMAAQLVWTPIDVVSQRLMVQGGKGTNSVIYKGGIDVFRRIIQRDGVKGLYKGFGISILTYAPSNAVWWASYSMAHRTIWGGVSSYSLKKDENFIRGFRPDSMAVVGVQGLSAIIASGCSALITMPLDTIKTRVQVLDGDQGSKYRKVISVGQTVRNLVKEGGLSACYRGLGPRWASMSISATTMITTYESLKKMSTN